MSQTEEWTIGRLLEWTTDYLRKHGSESPRLEAEVLLAHVRRSPRIALYTAFAEVPDESQRAAFREMVRKRAEGAPVAYLVGHKEFFSLDFIVTSDCLIPRPETEHLVIAALDWIKSQRRSAPESSWPRRIVEVGTGSGCVAISLAKHESACEVLAVDVSLSALAVARSNIEKHALDGRVTTCHSDLLESLPGDWGQVDMILSNPPYVSLSEWISLAKDVREFEPKQALVSGPAGTEVSQRLIEQAVSRLRIGGAIMIESSPMLVPILADVLKPQPEWRLLPIVKDLQGHPRILVAERVASG